LSRRRHICVTVRNVANLQSDKNAISQKSQEMLREIPE